jgi:hypothetical protein
MRNHDTVKLALLVVLAACGASPPPQEQPPPSMGRAISIEWKASQADGDQVVVTIVVDRKAIDLGLLPAATEMEAGTPNTCALRSAHPLRTEFVCGDMSAFFAAELEGNELVILFVDGHQWKEMRRVPVYGEGLAVAPYRLPVEPTAGSATAP